MMPKHTEPSIKSNLNILNDRICLKVENRLRFHATSQQGIIAKEIRAWFYAVNSKSTRLE